MRLSRDTELGIDLYRGITALLVLIGHVQGPILEPALGADCYAWPMGWQIAGFALGGGRFWVRFFFVISGFCIHQSISRSLEKGSFDLRSYILARLTRIYPVFLCGLALSAGWWLVSSGGKLAAFPLQEFLGNLVMIQQFTGVFPAFGASWSLTSEVCYYAVWPLALIWSAGNQRSAWHRSVGAALIGTLLIVAIWKIGFGGDRTHWLTNAWTVSGLYVVWLAGAWLAIEWRTVQAWITFRIWVLGIAWVLAVYLAEVTLTYYQARSWPFMLADYLAAPGFVVMIAGSHFCRISSSPGWTRFAQWMGMFSYPCYLLHVVLFEMAQAVVRPLVLQGHPVMQNLLALVLMLLVIGTFGIALETFFMRWRSGYLKAARMG